MSSPSDVPQAVKEQQQRQEPNSPSWAATSATTSATNTVTASAPSTSVQVIMSATGKKRKRLQRACDACHRAKRRCDGGLPCSNCDFSGRLCSYSDSQGKAVSPTKRTIKPSEAALQEKICSAPLQVSPQQPTQQHRPHSVSKYNLHHSSIQHSKSPSVTPHDVYHHPSSVNARLEPSLESRKELLSIFFSCLAPMSSVFDEISFLRDLSSMDVSQITLYTMYAVSANYAYEVHHQQQSASNNGRYSKLVAEAGNGIRYAKEARRLLYLEDESTGQSMVDGRPNLESAQSLFLLAFFEFSQGHYFKASSYIQLSSKHITSLASENKHSSPHSSGSSDDSITKALERRNIKRLTCLVTAMDVTMSMMNGQSMSTREWNAEALIATSCDAIRGDDDDEETKAMTQLLQISFVLNIAIELLQRKGTQSFEITSKQAIQCQNRLHQWSERLPTYLHFDETRLQYVEQLLNERNYRSRSPNASTQMSMGSAVCWTLMHSMAETTTLLLQEVTTFPDRSCRLEACRSLILLLEQSRLAQLPRLFVSFTITVLYTVSSSMMDQSQEHEWVRIWDRARTFATYARLGESIWTSMAYWWKKRSISISPQRSPTSSTSGRRILTITSPSMHSTTTTTSSHRSSLPSPPPLSNSYHYLHPLAKLPSSAIPTLPPLRLSISSSSEKTSRHFWDQPHRPAMTVNPS